MKETKFAISFDEEQNEKIDGLINKLLQKEKCTNEKLLSIGNLKLWENKKYEKDFQQINELSILDYLFPHLEIIYNINHDFFSIYNSLILIDVIFPESVYVNSNEISLTFFKEYGFPHNFMKLILDSFASEINNSQENRVFFVTNYVRIKKNNFSNKNIHYINYKNFIEKKILEIMQCGYSYSNSKAVDVSSTYKFGRHGNK